LRWRLSSSFGFALAFSLIFDVSYSTIGTLK
jgi:hypothetical protein